jgi:hypothetical protein
MNRMSFSASLADYSPHRVAGSTDHRIFSFCAAGQATFRRSTLTRRTIGNMRLTPWRHHANHTGSGEAGAVQAARAVTIEPVAELEQDGGVSSRFASMAEA